MQKLKYFAFALLLFSFPTFAKVNECSLATNVPAKILFSDFVQQAKAPRIKTNTFVRIAWIDHTGENSEQNLSGNLVSIYHSPLNDIYQLVVQPDFGEPTTFVFSPSWTPEEFELTTFERTEVTPVTEVKTNVVPDPAFEESYPFLDASAKTGYLKWKNFVEQYGIDATNTVSGFNVHRIRETSHGGSGSINPYLQEARANFTFRIIYIRSADGLGVFVLGVVPHKLTSINRGRDLTKSYEELVANFRHE